MTENQWLMFYDSDSKDYYYHNPHTKETVWDRPEGADIVCLENLQEVLNMTHTHTYCKCDCIVHASHPIVVILCHSLFTVGDH